MPPNEQINTWIVPQILVTNPHSDREDSNNDQTESEDEEEEKNFRPNFSEVRIINQEEREAALSLNLPKSTFNRRSY